jgi:drug/metabolite transporter (DMT)-like permease
VATSFAANHLAARIAFDHGASPATGVAVRATSTALILLLMMRLQGVALALPRNLRGWAFLAGLLIAMQSYSIYSAIALIPPALALLVFQTSALLYVLLSWAMGKEAPRWGVLPPMLVSLLGLALALDLRFDNFGASWSAIGVGALWALLSGASMTVVYYLNAHVLKAVDGRVRTFAMTIVTSLLVIVAGGATQTLELPRDGMGYLGLLLLTGFYCIAVVSLFVVLPRVTATSTAALNFEPIALLALAWVILGHTLTPLQVVGALITVGAIAWLGVGKRSRG